MIFQKNLKIKNKKYFKSRTHFRSHGSPTSITFRGVHFREIRPTSSKGGGEGTFPRSHQSAVAAAAAVGQWVLEGEKSGDLLLSVLFSPIWRRTKRPLVIIVPSFSPLRSIIWTFEEEEEEEEEEERAEMEKEDRLDRVLSPSHPRLPRGFSSFLRWTSIDDDDACFAFCVPSPRDFLPRPAASLCREKGKLSGYIGILAWDLGFFPSRIFPLEALLR